MEKVYNFMGGRKLLFALILMLVASGFVWFEKVNGQQWIEFMKWIFGTYAVGNVGEHLSKMLKK
jgi:hypothetical protein